MRSLFRPRRRCPATTRTPRISRARRPAFSARLGDVRDRGMATAEYAVATVAACAFAGLLFKVVTSGQVMALLTGIVKKALTLPM